MVVLLPLRTKICTVFLSSRILSQTLTLSSPWQGQAVASMATARQHNLQIKRLKARRIRGFDNLLVTLRPLRRLLKVKEVLAQQAELRMPVSDLGRTLDALGILFRTRTVYFLERHMGVFRLSFDPITMDSNNDFKGRRRRSMVQFTPEALQLLREEERVARDYEPCLVEKVRKLLMLSVERRVPLNKVCALERELALPHDFLTRFVHSYPQFFKVVREGNFEIHSHDHGDDGNTSGYNGDNDDDNGCNDGDSSGDNGSEHGRDGLNDDGGNGSDNGSNNANNGGRNGNNGGYNGSNGGDNGKNGDNGNNGGNIGKNGGNNGGENGSGGDKGDNAGNNGNNSDNGGHNNGNTGDNGSNHGKNDSGHNGSNVDYNGTNNGDLGYNGDSGDKGNNGNKYYNGDESYNGDNGGNNDSGNNGSNDGDNVENGIKEVSFLELTSWDDDLAITYREKRMAETPLHSKDGEIMPTSFRLLAPKGQRLKLGERKRMNRWQRAYFPSPYTRPPRRGSNLGSGAAGKRSVALIHEFLSLTVEKMANVDKLELLKKEFKLPNRLEALLQNHYCIFYFTTKGHKTAFLKEAFRARDHPKKPAFLIEKDPHAALRESYQKLIDIRPSRRLPPLPETEKGFDVTETKPKLLRLSRMRRPRLFF